jgi:hypothetical protein
MTRKDYKLIAQALSDQIMGACSLGLVDKSRYLFFQDICGTLANRLGEENPRFDRSKFLEACQANHEI